MLNIEKAIEAAARALCRSDGNPENTKFEGKPMWQICPRRKRRSKLRCHISGTNDFRAHGRFAVGHDSIRIAAVREV